MRGWVGMMERWVRMQTAGEVWLKNSNIYLNERQTREGRKMRRRDQQGQGDHQDHIANPTLHKGYLKKRKKKISTLASLLSLLPRVPLYVVTLSYSLIFSLSVSSDPKRVSLQED